MRTEENERYSWSLDLPRRMWDTDITQVAELIEILNSVQASSEETNSRRWKWSHNGVFSVKTAYLNLHPSIMENK
ncbi:hypothetical protein BVC80_1717g15 [Macleaya cordata]|uniref:Uncharacterized protein n=1 Tax=Macleaya cordata TaxID=56857 RepID=A0A200Q1W5_MACCD|nr:hypothetical protein BVC80_1717g15 [Macleaya cordata]